MSRSTSFTFGITSHAFSIITVSHILASSLFISSKLCKVARLIVDQSNITGVNIATGVITQVLQT